jgi:hypothetical protein
MELAGWSGCHIDTHLPRLAPLPSSPNLCACARGCYDYSRSGPSLDLNAVNQRSVSVGGNGSRRDNPGGSDNMWDSDTPRMPFVKLVIQVPFDNDTFALGV